MTFKWENIKSKIKNVFTSVWTIYVVGGSQLVLGLFLLGIWISLGFKESFFAVAVGTLLDQLGVWLLLTSAVALIVVGVVGCASACTRNRRAALLFDILSQMIAIGKIGIMVLLAFNFEKQVEEGVTEMAQQAVRLLYSNSPWATDWIDWTQQYFRCCGSVSYASWATSKYNGYGNGHPYFQTKFEVPKSCCLDPLSGRCESGRDPQLTATQLQDVIYTDGCIPKISDYIKSCIPLFMYATAGYTVFELLVGLLGIIDQGANLLGIKTTHNDEESVLSSSHSRQTGKPARVRTEKDRPFR